MEIPFLFSQSGAVSEAVDCKELGFKPDVALARVNVACDFQISISPNALAVKLTRSLCLLHSLCPYPTPRYVLNCVAVRQHTVKSYRHIAPSFVPSSTHYFAKKFYTPRSSGSSFCKVLKVSSVSDRAQLSQNSPAVQHHTQAYLIYRTVVRADIRTYELQISQIRDICVVRSSRTLRRW